MANDVQQPDISESQIYGMYNRFQNAAKMAAAAGDMDAAHELIEHAKDQLYKINAFLGHQSGIDNPTSGMGNAELAAAGVGQGMTDVARHTGNLVGAVSDEDLAAAQGRDAPLLATPAGFLGAGLGQGVASAIPAEGAVAALARSDKVPMVGKAIANAMRSSPVLRGATAGAIQGNVMTNPGQSRLANTALGATAGAAIPAAVQGVRKGVFGIDRTPEAQTLIDAGVYPTAGQMNPNGTASYLEQLPVIRQVLGALGVKSGIRNEWLRATTEAVAAPGTKIATGPADDMLEQAYQSHAPMYEQGKGFPVAPAIVRTAGQDIDLRTALAKAAKAPGATDDVQGAVQDWLRKNLNMRIRDAVKSGKPLLSDDLLQFRSDIRDQVRAYSKGTDSDSIGYTNAYKRANDAVTAALTSQLPPDAMAVVAAADAKYGQYVTLQDAVAKAAGHGRADIGPTPGEITSSVKQHNSGQAKGSFARGTLNSRLNDLAQAANATLMREDPTMRTGASVPLAALAELAGANAGHPWAPIIGGAGAAALSTSLTGRKLLAGAMPWQRTVAQKFAGLNAPSAMGLTGGNAPNLSGLLKPRPTIADLRDALQRVGANSGATYALRSGTQPTSMDEALGYQSPRLGAQ